MPQLRANPSILSEMLRKHKEMGRRATPAEAAADTDMSGTWRRRNLWIKLGSGAARTWTACIPNRGQTKTKINKALLVLEGE